jgi:hypothetical protein
VTTAVPPADGGFPVKRIVGWQRFLDLPDFAEHPELGLKHGYDSAARTLRLECPELGLVCDHLRSTDLAKGIADAAARDKLGGWPAWVQGVEYPNCPRCGRRMAHVFQVDSEHNVPFMFGDVGCGHITQCPEHKEVVAFGWACG